MPRKKSALGDYARPRGGVRRSQDRLIGPRGRGINLSSRVGPDPNPFNAEVFYREKRRIQQKYLLEELKVELATLLSYRRAGEAILRGCTSKQGQDALRFFLEKHKILITAKRAAIRALKSSE